MMSERCVIDLDIEGDLENAVRAIKETADDVEALVSSTTSTSMYIVCYWIVNIVSQIIVSVFYYIFIRCTHVQ